MLLFSTLRRLFASGAQSGKPTLEQSVQIIYLMAEQVKLCEIYGSS